MIEIPSPVGLCMYCAAHFDGLTEAFILSNSFFDQKLDQSGVPLGNIAGNSITSHWSAPFYCAIFLINLPVKSFLDQRVITITIAPPGCNL